MGFGGLFPWGILLQALAIIHFVRRRPDAYWLWVILFFPGLGALVYILVEVLPDAPLLRNSLRGVPRRRRIKQLEAIILDNPAVGNLEEEHPLDQGRVVRVAGEGALEIADRSLHVVVAIGAAAGEVAAGKAFRQVVGNEIVDGRSRGRRFGAFLLFSPAATHSCGPRRGIDPDQAH